MTEDIEKICCCTEKRIVFSVYWKKIYPSLKNKDPTLLKLTTRDDEIWELKHKTEKHVQENILKSLTIDDGYYRKKYIGLDKSKHFELTPNFRLNRF